jgi:rubrerythrin
MVTYKSLIYTASTLGRIQSEAFLGKSGRINKGDKEYDELQRARHENQRLKKEISALRKQLARIDFTRFQNLRELVNKQQKEEVQERKEQSLEKLKKKWMCRECGKDYLRLMIYEHPIKGICYYRKCVTPMCGHRTAMKPYTPEVTGITESGEVKDGKDET